MTEPILTGPDADANGEWKPFIPGLRKPSADRIQSWNRSYGASLGRTATDDDVRQMQLGDLEKLIRSFNEIDARFPTLEQWQSVTEPHMLMYLDGSTIEMMRDHLYAKFKHWELDLFEGLIHAGYFGAHWGLSTREHVERLKKAVDNHLAEEERQAFEEKLREAKRWEKARRQAKRELDAEETASQLSTSEADSRVIRGGSILDEPPGVPAIWGEGDNVLWAKGQGIMIASQQGVGKTTIAQQLVLHRIAVRDEMFLGYSVQDTTGVTVYLAMDRPQQAIGSFRRMVTEDDREQLDKFMVIRKGPLPVDALAKPGALADYLQLIAPDCDTVVIDSVKDMAGGRSLSSDEVGAGINSAIQECLARGIEVLLLHHQRKAQNGSERLNSLDDVFGSTLITSGLGSVFALKGTPGTLTPELIHLKQPAMPVEMTLRHNHATGTTTVENGAVEAIDIIRERGEAGITLGDLAMRRFGRAEKADKQKAQREIQQFIRAMQVRKVTGQVTAEGRQPDLFIINPGVDRIVRGASGE